MIIGFFFLSLSVVALGLALRRTARERLNLTYTSSPDQQRQGNDVDASKLAAQPRPISSVWTTSLPKPGGAHFYPSGSAASTKHARPARYRYVIEVPEHPSHATDFMREMILIEDKNQGSNIKSFAQKSKVYERKLN